MMHRYILLSDCRCHLDTVISLQYLLMLWLSIMIFKGSGGQMDKVSASQPLDRGFEPHTTMIPDMTSVLVGSRK